MLSTRRGLRIERRGDAPWFDAAARRAADLVECSLPRHQAAASGRSRAPRLAILPMDELPGRVRRVRKPEGYALSISPEGAWLAGADAPGLAHGATTLSQLLNATGGRALPCVDVRDWPRHVVRGIHVYMPARRELGFFQRLLDHLCELRFNTVFLEVGAGMAYDRHPEINAAWRRFVRETFRYPPSRDPAVESKGGEADLHRRYPSGPVALQCSRYFPKNSVHPELAGGDCLSREEVRHIVAACRARHIEVIPEVQSFGHAYYLCVAHPEIAERADDPWPDTYCPSNPRTYELLFDVLDEVIEVFEPRTVHIGHDEIQTIGVCGTCRSRRADAVLAEDVNRIHDFLAERGVRTAMWGDKLMPTEHGGNARHRRDAAGRAWILPATHRAIDRIPRDVLILDWHWGFGDDSQDYFHRHGFETIFGNYSPLGMRAWARRAGAPGVRGAEVSTWCEVSAYAYAHNGVFRDLFAAADRLWRGTELPRRALESEMARRLPGVVDRFTGRRRWSSSADSDPATPVSLASAAMTLPVELRGRLMTRSVVTTPLGLPAFRPSVDGGGRLERAVVLDRDNPRSKAVTVDAAVDRLLILAGCAMPEVYFRPTFYSFHRGPAVVMNATVTYHDDRRRRFRVVYGEDVGPLHERYDEREYYRKGAATSFRALPIHLSGGYTLYVMEWTNPRPGERVRSVLFELGPDAVGEGEVVIAGVSVAQCEVARRPRHEDGAAARMAAGATTLGS